MSISPPRPTSVYLQTPFLGTPMFQNSNQLQIPSIQIQAATPSPVQMFPQQPFPDSMPPASTSDVFTPPEQISTATSSLLPPQQQEYPATQIPSGSRKQRFTMGPRADCELCQRRVKGHYMHFD